MTPTKPASVAEAVAIRPFQVNVPEADLTDLRRRIVATRLPEKETVGDFTQGVPLATVQKLARYWATDYDWRKVEARMNAVPNFITEIDGLDIHFIHVRSKHENALPVIIAHGWPGSVVEQLKLIEPLTNPTAHGGTAADAFDVVIPNMPGYGFSGKPTGTGWGPDRIARAWIVLMQRLGYSKFVAQGGDWGAVVVDLMGLAGAAGAARHPHQHARHLPRGHQRSGLLRRAGASGSVGRGEASPSSVCRCVYQKGIGYGYQMGLRPQTMYGIADSPVGLAAYFLDHDARSLEMIARVFDGASEGLTRDDVLDNITIAWLTNTGVSGARLYWEYWGKGYFDAKGVSIPVAVSVFPDELYPAPRSWSEQAYPNLIHYNQLPKGGHFAAWEQPKLMSEEMRAGFRSLRQ